MDARRLSGDRSRPVMRGPLAMAMLCWAVAAVGAQPASPSPAVSEAELRAQIEQRRALLQRPCDEVQQLMEDLVRLGQAYLRLERERTERFGEIAGQESAFLRDFLLEASPDGRAEPGRLYREHAALKDRASQAGILAEGPRPAGVGRDELVLRPDAGRYFYFADGDRVDPERTQLRYALEEAQTALVDRWNARRQEYYEAFADREVERHNDAVQTPLGLMGEVREEYLAKRDLLARLALSGDFAHCLGEMHPLPGYQLGLAEDGTWRPLYLPAPPDTPEGLPGMGFQMPEPRRYPLFQRHEIPDFPFQFHLKTDGNQALSYAKELRETRIEAEREYTLILGRSWRNVCTLGLTYLLPPDEIISKLPEGAIKDQLQQWEERDTKASAFTYGVTYQLVKANAALGEMLKYPLEHGVEKSYEQIVGFGAAIRDFPVNRLGEVTEQLLTEPIEKLAGGAAVTWDQLTDPDRFEPKEGETLRQEVERLGQQLEAVEKVREATQTAEEVTAELVSMLTGTAQLEAGRQALTWGRKTGGRLAVEEGRAALAVQRLEHLQAEAGLVGRDLPALPDLPAEAKALDELFSRQQALNRELAALARAEPPPRMGRALPAEGNLTVVDPKTGRELSLEHGKLLGEGSTSRAFVKADNDALVIRQTALSEQGALASRLDDFGRKAIEEEVRSDALRVARREAVFEEKATVPGWDDQLQAAVERETVVSRVEVVERVEGTAKEIIERNLQKTGAALTQGQGLAYEQALRDLNASGYAWLDNHYKNYTFEPLPGQDRWRVVVVDPGGIVKVRGGDLAEAARNARAMQQRLEQVTSTPHDPDKFLEVFEKRQQVLTGSKDYEARSLVDLQAMGLDDASAVPFAMKNGIRPPLGELAGLSDEVLVQRVRGHLETALSGDPRYQALKDEFDRGQASLVEKLDDLEQAHRQASEALQAARPARVPDGPSGPPAASGLVDLLNQEVDVELWGRIKGVTDAVLVNLMEVECARYRELYLAGYDRDKLRQMGNPCPEEEAR